MANVRRDKRPAVAARADVPPALVTRSEGLTGRSALMALGRLQSGARLALLSKGAVSMGDVLAWALEQTGPADVLLSTWTIASDEIGALGRLVTGGGIRRLRLLTDFSFRHRHPAYCAQLRGTFGPESVALTVVHAKLAVITNEQWSVVVRSSANLNRNSRVEFYEVSDERALAEYLAGVLGEWFPPAADQWEAKPIEHKRRFTAWHGQDGQDDVQAGPEASRPAAGRLRPLGPATAEDARFFSDDWAGTDLRRAGTITYSR